MSHRFIKNMPWFYQKHWKYASEGKSFPRWDYVTTQRTQRLSEATVGPWELRRAGHRDHSLRSTGTHQVSLPPGVSAVVRPGHMAHPDISRCHSTGSREMRTTRGRCWSCPDFKASCPQKLTSLLTTTQAQLQDCRSQQGHTSSKSNKTGEPKHS